MYRTFCARKLCSYSNIIFHSNPNYRFIYSVNGSWESELTNEIKKNIELHWKSKINDHYDCKDKPKFYLLSMFPYPSGKLHMGHVRVYTISDAIARFLRMNGKQVIHPIGWDAFGLPAENAAIEKNIHPYTWTKNNIKTMKQQFKELNISFNWEKELATCDPSYYKWTQYLFLLMYEAGLAYKKMALVNWDPIDNTVLADEQVDENGCSWRSGCKVEKRRLSQWFLRTSFFSKNLYDGLNESSLVEWRDVIKIQKHWIGPSEGYTFHLNVIHKSKILKDVLTVWTSKPELLYGAVFIAISSHNHFNMPEWGGGTSTEDQLLELQAIHPLTGVPMPIYVTENLDLVPSTDSCIGIVTDENNAIHQFAKKHKIPTINVIDYSSNALINSQEFSGMDFKTGHNKILDKVKENGILVYPSSRKLRDWLISRQRYWGTPIPIIHCPSCKVVPVPIEDLPVRLPNIEDKVSGDWINVQCPRCNQPATRESDTMDTFVDSSWYYLRFLDPSNESQPFSLERIGSLMPVDLYIGGKEHASLHLFYARFVCHFLHSVGLLKEAEPFCQLLMQGMILGKTYKVKHTGKYIAKEQVDFSGQDLIEKVTGASVVEDWEKMSKSKYNGVDPEVILDEHGMDTTRLFILGNIAPQSERKWNDSLFSGIWKWQRRIWLTLSAFMERKKKGSSQLLTPEEIVKHELDLFKDRNYYIKGVTHNFINTRQLSVAISKLQGMTGTLRRMPDAIMQTSLSYEETLASLIVMLAPLAPHFASELWAGFCSAASPSQIYNLNDSVLRQKWPEVDMNAEMEIRVKLNGEEVDSVPMLQRDLLKLPESKAIELALNREKILDKLQGIKVRHTRYKKWPYYDSEVNIIFTPPGKKKKIAVKL